jgi:hypothetical protein
MTDTVKPIDDMSDEEQAAMTPLEKVLVETLLEVNNVARNWSDRHRAIEKIVDLTATVFDGKASS